MNLPKELFKLQIIFAKKISVLKNISIEESLLKYTNLYKIFRIRDWKFEANNPVWENFLAGIDIQDLENYTFNFYLQQLSLNPEDNIYGDPSFGCFSYDYNSETKRISIHFSNKDNYNNIGPLSKEKISKRKNELKQMFESIKQNYGDVPGIKVYGHSWLYNIDAYKRLFPHEYTSQFINDINCFRGFGQWAQFLNSEGNLKVDLVNEFLKRLERLDNIDYIESVFPLKVMHGEVPIEIFYNFYGELNNELVNK